MIPVVLLVVESALASRRAVSRVAVTLEERLLGVALGLVARLGELESLAVWAAVRVESLAGTEVSVWV